MKAAGVVRKTRNFSWTFGKRWDVANPAAKVPAALLGPDGRYACDSCEALTNRAELTETIEGFHCPHCMQQR